MRTLIIDRFEGAYAICEEQTAGKENAKGKKKKDLRYFGILREEVPKEAKEGDVLVIDDEGNLKIDAAATKARRKKIRQMEEKAFKD